MIRAKLTKAEVEAKPYSVWNAFVDLLYGTPAEDLTDAQLAAKIVLHYDGEINNGGHLQFFLNTSGDDALYADYLSALSAVGAEQHRTILGDALRVWHSKPRTQPQTSEEYAALAQLGDLDAMDAQFGIAEPTLDEYLERYLEAHQDLFIEII